MIQTFYSDDFKHCNDVTSKMMEILFVKESNPSSLRGQRTFISSAQQEAAHVSQEMTAGIRWRNAGVVKLWVIWFKKVMTKRTFQITTLAYCNSGMPYVVL